MLRTQPPRVQAINNFGHNQKMQSSLRKRRRCWRRVYVCHVRLHIRTAQERIARDVQAP